jgi:hypothetical protein
MMEMRVFIERNIILAIQHLVPLKCFDQRDKTLVCESSTEQDRWIICRLLSFWPRNLPVSFRPSTQTFSFALNKGQSGSQINFQKAN